ncbi:MAG: hypothetical protein FWE35_00990 [Streptosporangiales bacterium]|nr:hypothetical protein [Streptosporangiales bacterium]
MSGNRTIIAYNTKTQEITSQPLADVAADLRGFGADHKILGSADSGERR